MVLVSSAVLVFLVIYEVLMFPLGLGSRERCGSGTRDGDGYFLLHNDDFERFLARGGEDCC